ncbi:MAG: type III polyketide synthase [Actinomycetes bacterium]
MSTAERVPAPDGAGSSVLAAVGTALGDHRYPQQVITEAFGALVVPDPERRGLLERLHAAAGVRTRHLALPLEAYRALAGFTAANEAYVELAVDLGARAVTAALVGAGLSPGDVDLVMSVTVTGVAAPSVEARLVPLLGLREDVKRVPVFGLGCVAGAAGVARVHDYLLGHPDDVAVLLSVELCSLTVQRDDSSTANLVASGLFGDGAAAVVIVGARRAAALGLDGPRVVASRSRLYPDTERVMGWDVGGSGFRVVLSASVADVVAEHLGRDVKGFLSDHGVEQSEVGHWVAHPGGPKVLHAMQSALQLPDGALDTTWRSLAAVGNLSSASVLHVLADTMAADPDRTGAPAVMLAMGPGFCAELVLLRW